jgi:hypothetical protein
MKRSRWLKPALLALVVLVLGFVAVTSQSVQPTWQLGQMLAPPKLLQQVAQDNLNPDFPVDPGQMRILKIQQSRQAQPLYLIDARLGQAAPQPLCGAAGCAFWGYRPTKSGFQKVFAAYLNPHLPPGTPLVEPLPILENGLPQLTIHQLDGTVLQHLTLAFNGQTYAIAQVDYLPISYE